MINLGAGFDTLFWRLRQEDKPVNNFIEVRRFFFNEVNVLAECKNDGRIDIVEVEKKTL